MKKVKRKLILIISVFIVLSIEAKAQFSIELGPNTIVLCATDTTLGLNLQIAGGTPPYSYTWSGMLYPLNNPTTIYPASLVLSDTTLPNPHYDFLFGNSVNTFYLTVTDSSGNSAADSIVVIESIALINNIWYDYFITPSDSIQFSATYFLISPHGWLAYLWIPSYGLTDPTNPYTWASPDTTTFYHISMIDSCGCYWEHNPIYNVYVLPNSIDENNLNNPELEIYPNPAFSLLNIQNNSAQLFQFTLYNSLGEKIITKSLTNKTSIIDLSDYSDGIYFYKLISDKQLIKSGKIIKQ